VAIGATSPERANAAAAREGIPSAYVGWQEIACHPEIDAVAIATPPHLQPEIAMAALASKKAVFAEKPLALTVQDAEILCQTARSSKLANVVDFTFPELATWQQTRELVRQGAIGELRHINLDWRMESYDNQKGLRGWKTRADLGGGALQHFGSHTLYYLEWLFGPIVGLFAKLSCSPDALQDGDTFVVLAVRFANGVSGSVTLSNAAPFGSGHRLEVYGGEGSLRLMNTEQDVVRGFRLSVATRADSNFREIAVESSPEPGTGVDSRVRPVSRLAARFLDWVEGNVLTAPSFQAGLRVQQLIAAAQQSEKSGRWVDCPPAGAEDEGR
jgi:predicted dehydrogenase